jgi:hypothetical protein
MVRNPFRSEADAFYAVLGIGAGAAAVGVAAWLGGAWAGIGVLLVLGTATAVWLFTATRQPPLPSAVRPGRDDEWRILVVANETLDGDALYEAVRLASAAEGARVHVVCPALNRPLQMWVSDEDAAIAAAHVRLDESLARLSRVGIPATGTVGDSDPLQAIDDVLRVEGADAIVISTHPPGRSHWLERGLVERAAQRFGLPITHVVVDLEAVPSRPEPAASPT